MKGSNCDMAPEICGAFESLLRANELPDAERSKSRSLNCRYLCGKVLTCRMMS